MMSKECTLSDPRWRQCCCNCEHHIPDYSHPHIDDQPIDHQKGWICVVPVVAFREKRASSDWPEHSVGCELYAAKPTQEEIVALENDPELGELGYHEALDRTHILQCNFDEYIACHPVVAKHPKFKETAGRIGNLLMDLYQELGAEIDEKFSESIKEPTAN